MAALGLTHPLFDEVSRSDRLGTKVAVARVGHNDVVAVMSCVVGGAA